VASAATSWRWPDDIRAAVEQGGRQLRRQTQRGELGELAAFYRAGVIAQHAERIFLLRNLVL
jgi:hypothetical protein